jgi:hypothetical protein
MTLTGTDATQLSLAGNLTTSGANPITLTTTGSTSITLPTSGTMVGSVTTGNGVSATNTAGALAFSLGVITPTSVNGITLASGANTFSATVGNASIDIAAAATLNVDKNLTVQGTYGTVLSSAGQDNTLTLNESLTVGDGNSGTITYSAGSKTLTVEDNATVNQDLTTDASVQFAAVKLTTGAGAGYLLTSDADGDASWAAASTGLPRSYLAGLALSNAADTDHDITIAVGKTRDTTDAYDLALASVMTKRIDASWAAGSTNGGMATGTVGNTTWYHVHLIRKTADGTIDAMFDTSLTAANIPAGYTGYRRVGSVLTDGSANIINFYQVGDDFFWLDPVLNINTANPGASAVSATMSLPLGVVVKGLLAVSLLDSYSDNIIYISSLNVTDAAASATCMSVATMVNTGAEVGSQVIAYTNTSSQIRYRTSYSAATTTIKISTLGWTDRRGRDD